MSWKPCTLMGEARRNLGAAAGRSLLMVAVVASLTGALAWSEFQTSESLLAFHRRFVASGGHVAVVSNPSGVPAHRCEALASRADVLAAGGFSIFTAMETNSAPGTLFQVAAATPGLVGVWAPEARLTDADLIPGLLVGEAAAEELGIGAGRFLGFGVDNPQVVAAVIDTTPRYEEAERWIIQMIPPVGSVENCWVETTAGAFGPMLSALPALFADTGPQLSVRRHLVLDEFAFDPKTALLERPQANGWAVAGIAASLLIWVGTWFRRPEISLYRALGTRRAEVFIMTSIETGAVVVTGSILGMAWAAAIVGARTSALSADQILIAVRTVASTAALGVLLGPLASLVVARGGIAIQLKDR